MNLYPDLYGPLDEIFTLQETVKEGRLNQLKFLIGLGMDVNKKDEKGKTPIMVSNDYFCSIALLDAGANLIDVDFSGRSATWNALELLLSNAKPVIQHGKHFISKEKVFLMALYAKHGGIEHDPRGIRIARKIRTLLREGLRIDWKEPMETKEFQIILQHVEAVEAKHKYEKLAAKLKGEHACGIIKEVKMPIKM